MRESRGRQSVRGWHIPDRTRCWRGYDRQWRQNRDSRQSRERRQDRNPRQSWERRPTLKEVGKYREEEGWTHVTKRRKLIRNRIYETQESNRDEARKKKPEGKGPDHMTTHNTTQEHLSTVQGITNLENTSWLNRSLIVETKTPSSREDLLLRMVKHWPTMCIFRDLGSFKFIVTFSSYDDREEALEKEDKEAIANYIQRKFEIFVKEIEGRKESQWTKEQLRMKEDDQIISSRVSDTHSQKRNSILEPPTKNMKVEVFDEEENREHRDVEAKQKIHGEQNDNNGGQMALEGGQRVINNGGAPIEETLEAENFLNDLEENKEFIDDSLDSQKTAVGNIAYNLEEEIALIAQYEKKGSKRKAHYADDQAQFADMPDISSSQSDYDRAYLGEEAQCGPNHFVYATVQHPPNIDAVEAQCDEGQQDDKAENIPPQAPTRNKGKKKIAQKQKASATVRSTRKGKLYISSQKDVDTDKVLQYEDSSDDAQENKEDEARLTWEISKELNLKALNEDKIKDRIIMLRRSARKRGGSGKEGNH
ncbi:hypothetical protein RIF29_16034 [Crotalaria pallida]|uniref:Uncharacterized protein n=1 Tax=Crotalaria pallida TaxID=3830 RepID=A0AAN9FEC8_CROPI